MACRQIGVLGSEDKRQVTVVTACAADGTMLPCQTIFEGKTEATLPPKVVLDKPELKDFDWTQSTNHWSNMETTKRWFQNILMPYLRNQFFITGIQKAVLLLDCWNVHLAAEFREWVAATYPEVVILYIPAGCTPIGQPCDIAVQRPFKHAITGAFNEWSMNSIVTQMRAGAKVEQLSMDLRISNLKPR